VIVCAGIIYMVIQLKPQIQTAWPNEGLLYLCYGVIILVAIVSSLSGMATDIAVQRDWVVEICCRDKSMLASKYCLSKVYASSKRKWYLFPDLLSLTKNVCNQAGIST